MKVIELTQGKITKVDDSNFERCSCVCWHFHNGYARNRQLGYLHHFIMYCNEMLDHINRDTLDNQEHNLRLASQSQNNQNAIKRKNCSSVYKGVSFNRRRQLWEAYIGCNSYKIWLGIFTLEIEAAKAYDVAALQRFGKFARLNF